MGRGYPAARFHDEAHSIPGVLVGIDPALLADVITWTEAEGVLYRRVHVATSGGPAISYEWLGAIDGLRPLPDGWSSPLQFQRGTDRPERVPYAYGANLES